MITKDNKKYYFGQAGYSDFTIHKDEARKQRYIIDTRKLNINIVINLELIQFLFGPSQIFCYGMIGIYQQ